MAERRPRRRRGENRERLLQAGLIEFGLFGYHGASTAAIAERAEVPQPHVYANFRTKQELFLACVGLACAELAGSAPRAAVQGAVRAKAQSEVLQRMVLQAVSAVRDPSLSEALPTELRTLRTELGEQRFAALLGAACSSLLAREGTSQDSKSEPYYTPEK